MTIPILICQPKQQFNICEKEVGDHLNDRGYIRCQTDEMVKERLDINKIHDDATRTHVKDHLIVSSSH